MNIRLSFRSITVTYSVNKLSITETILIQTFIISHRSILTLRFGIIINDGPIFKVNLVGLALNLGYISFYYWYVNTTNDRKSFWNQIAYGAAAAAAVLAYSFLENPKYLTQRYGMLVTIILFYFVGSPLLKLVSGKNQFSF